MLAPRYSLFAQKWRRKGRNKELEIPLPYNLISKIPWTAGRKFKSMITYKRKKCNNYVLLTIHHDMQVSFLLEIFSSLLFLIICYTFSSPFFVITFC